MCTICGGSLCICTCVCVNVYVYYMCLCESMCVCGMHVHVCVFTWCLMCLSFYLITFHHCVFAEEPAVFVLPVWRIVKLMCRVLCGRFAGDAGLCHQHLSVVNIPHCIERL